MGCGASSVQVSDPLPRPTRSVSGGQRTADAEVSSLQQQISSLQQQVAEQNSILIQFCSATCTLNEHIISSTHQRHTVNAAELQRQLEEETDKVSEETGRGGEEVEVLKVQLKQERDRVVEELDKVERSQKDTAVLKKLLIALKESIAEKNFQEAKGDEMSNIEEEIETLQKLLGNGKKSKVEYACMTVMIIVYCVCMTL